jgi:hypothetical protein
MDRRTRHSELRPLVEATDAVIAAAGDLQDALAAGLQTLAATRAALLAGTSATVTLEQLGNHGRAQRMQSGAAIDAYERAVMTFRGEIARALVDEGMTLADAARVMGVSRQVVTRLHAAATARRQDD